MYKARQTHKLAEIKGGDWDWATCDEQTNVSRKEDGDLIKKRSEINHYKRPNFDSYQIWIGTEIDL